MCKIAKHLDRNKSNVFRELKRKFQRLFSE
ncbi:MAG: hypothetical protein IKI08_00900 [Selenomonadaceae bacterium]|nr:hypothetical protein [Selenomonadaceae bacterium]